MNFSGTAHDKVNLKHDKKYGHVCTLYRESDYLLLYLKNSFNMIVYLI